MSEIISRQNMPNRLTRFGVAAVAAGVAIAGCSTSETKVTAATSVLDTAVPVPRSSVTPTSSEAPAGTFELVLRPDSCDADSLDPVIRGDEVLYCEEVQAPQIKTFKNYENAGGIIGILREGDRVLVSCLIEDEGSDVTSAATNKDKPGVAEWYVLKQGGYAASNTFVNDPGDKIPTNDEPTADPRVPLC